MTIRQRIERLEASQQRRFPWQAVCGQCAAKGLTTTPRRNCEARRCDRTSQLTADQAERMRVEWLAGEQLAGRSASEALERQESTLTAESQAWEAEKARQWRA